ncbi:NAD-binding protein, partial [Turicimonas muris]
AVTLACCLGQIGEFSFILGTLGVSLGLLTKEGMNLVLAAAILTIALNPISFSVARPVAELLCKHFRFARTAAARLDPQSTMPDEVESKKLLRHVVIVGYSSIGRKVCEILTKQKIPFVVVDKQDDVISTLRKQGLVAIQGDCTDPATLLQAHVQNSAQLVLTISDELESRKAIAAAKILNPDIEIIIRAVTDTEADHLRSENLGIVVQASTALALRIAQYSIYSFTKYSSGGHSKRKEEEAEEKAKDMLDDLVADEERTVEKSTQHERLMHSSNKPTDSMEK